MSAWAMPDPDEDEPVRPVRRASPRVVALRVVFWTLLALWCGVMMIGGTTLLASLIRRFFAMLP